MRQHFGPKGPAPDAPKRWEGRRKMPFRQRPDCNECMSVVQWMSVRSCSPRNYRCFQPMRGAFRTWFIEGIIGRDARHAPAGPNPFPDTPSSLPGLRTQRSRCRIPQLELGCGNRWRTRAPIPIAVMSTNDHGAGSRNWNSVAAIDGGPERRSRCLAPRASPRCPSTGRDAQQDRGNPRMAGIAGSHVAIRQRPAAPAT